MKNSPKYNLESARWRLVVRSWRMEPSYGEAAEDLAKETGSGLEEFQCCHQITPQKIQKQPSVHVAVFYLSVSGGPADVLSEWRSTALVTLALFLLV